MARMKNKTQKHHPTILQKIKKTKEMKEYMEREKCSYQVAADYHHESKTTAMRWLKKFNEHKEHNSMFKSKKRKNLYNGNKKKMMVALMDKVEQIKDAQLPTDRWTLVDRCVQIDNKEELNLGIQDKNDWWIYKTMKGINITRREICGNAATVNQLVVRNFRVDWVEWMLHTYGPENIYNLDETGKLFFFIYFFSFYFT